MEINSFKQHLNEQAELGLTVFDLDETLFHTKAKIRVMHGGKVVHTLDNQQYNHYKLKPGESFDYGEFRSAEIFAKTSTPVAKMIGKARAIIHNAFAKGSRVIISTARADFDDKEVFLRALDAYGIDTNKIHIERAGNFNLGSSAKNKKVVFRKYLRSGLYKRIRFFDDDINNLTSFKSLQKEYPDIAFEAWHVESDGSVTKY